MLVAGCGAASQADDRPSVVVTTPILGDVVSQLVGDEAEAEVLMPPGADPHEFQLSAAQAQALRDADLVIANGLQLEQGIHDALESAEEDGIPVLEVAAEVNPIPFGEHSHEHSDEAHDHEHGSLDPHFWFDPLRMADAVDMIADELAELQPEVAWGERAVELRDELEALHAEAGDILARVPEDQRVLVTSHDALGYLAERYDFEIVGAVIPSGSTLAQSSARHLQELAEIIEREQVPAIFAESTVEPDLVEALAREVGGDVEVVTLYTDSLGEPGSGAETYADMLRLDAQCIARALA